MKLATSFKNNPKQDLKHTNTYVRNEFLNNKDHVRKDFCKFALENMLQNQEHFLERCHFPQAVLQPKSHLNSSDVGEDCTELGQ